MNTFETWTFDGVRFLAIPNGKDVHIMDENGQNYGSWMDLETFRSRQRNRGNCSPLGKCRLQQIIDR